MTNAATNTTVARASSPPRRAVGSFNGGRAIRALAEQIVVIAGGRGNIAVIKCQAERTSCPAADTERDSGGADAGRENRQSLVGRIAIHADLPGWPVRPCAASTANPRPR